MLIKFKPSFLLRSLSLASTIGLSLGIAALVVVMSVADGFENMVKMSATRYMGPIILLKKTISPTEIDEVKDLCKDCEVINYADSRAVVSSGVKTTYVILDALNPTELFPHGFPKTPSFGKWAEGESEIVLGKEIVSKLNIKLGEELSVLSEVNGRLEKFYYRLTGIHNFGYQQLNERFGFIAYDYKLPGMKEGLKIYPASDLDEKIELFKRNYDFPWLMKSWKDLNTTMIEAIAYEKIMLFIVMGFIVLMAVLNLSATVYTIVFERRSEFSILRAHGLEKKVMVKNLVLSGLQVCWKGVVIGILLGIGISVFIDNVPLIHIPSEIYMIETIPSKVTISMIIFIIIFSFLTCLIGAIIPALLIARRPIAEGLLRE